MAGDVTRILERVRAGDDEAPGELFGLLYPELRSLAAALFRSQRRNHTLQPTAVLHEAYLKMARADGSWQDRAHFFGVAARAMRQVLVNHARDGKAKKRGGGQELGRVTLSAAPDTSAEREVDVLAVHEALEQLAELDRRQASIAELRFFAGLTVPEVAEVLGLAPRTVELEWKMAKDWLAQRLGDV